MLSNKDLMPIAPKKRTWKASNSCGLAFKLLRGVRRMNILLLNVWSGLKDIGGELEPVWPSFIRPFVIYFLLGASSSFTPAWSRLENLKSGRVPLFISSSAAWSGGRSISREASARLIHIREFYQMEMDSESNVDRCSLFFLYRLDG